mgnify:CR=1 FL=1
MLSSTAEHLFWLARSMERAENTARMLDVTWRMALYHFHHLINQLRQRLPHYFVSKWSREFKQFVKFGFHVSSGVTTK